MLNSYKIENISDKMNELIKIGHVTARDPNMHKVKVMVDDTVSKPLETAWLPVLLPRVGKEFSYDLPDIGDWVLVVFMPTGEEDGFVLGEYYAGSINPPMQSGDKTYRRFNDGSTIEYDRATHKLTADVKGDAVISATGKIDVVANGDITISAGGNLTLVASGEVSIGSGTGGVNMTGSNVNIN